MHHEVRHRWSRGLALSALLVFGSACTTTSDNSSTTVAIRAESSTTESPATETTPATEPPPTEGPCAGLEAVEEGTVEFEPLVETSGLAASQQFPETVWAHNDSGQATAVYAIGANGAARATFDLGGIEGVDIEDIAVVDGSIYLADIGDNDAERETVSVYRFDEPDPSTGDGTITEIDVGRFRYPDGARDAEAFLVDPLTGELLVIEKAFGFGAGGGGLVSPRPATVYVAPALPLDDSDAELVAAGTVAMDELAQLATASGPPEAIFSTLGIEGVATAADIRADGRLIAVRTYATVWLFERDEGETVAEALASMPCEAPTIVESQGESVAFLDASSAAFVTVSEGRFPAWNVTSLKP